MKNSRRVAITRIGFFAEIDTENASPIGKPDHGQIQAGLDRPILNPEAGGHAA